MGQFNGAGPVVVADHRKDRTDPAGLSYAEAATIAAAFLTAYYAFAHLAHAKAGERVLVHAATGGLGMAAVQLAKHWGLDVYATASPGSGTHCGAWASPTTISRARARPTSSRSSPPRPAAREWTSYSIV